MEQHFRVGVITNTHGIKGEVKVYPTTEDIKRFDYLKEALIDTGNELVEVNVSGVKYFKNIVIVKFIEFDNINDVEKYKGKALLVTRENAIKKEDGKYFIADLVGCDVITDTGERLGVLTDVMLNNANDVYVVAMENQKEVLLPVIPECVLQKDVEKKVITVHLMKGLLDL